MRIMESMIKVHTKYKSFHKISENKNEILSHIALNIADDNKKILILKRYIYV